MASNIGVQAPKVGNSAEMNSYRSINRSHAQTGQQSILIHKGHSLLWSLVIILLAKGRQS